MYIVCGYKKWKFWKHNAMDIMSTKISFIIFLTFQIWIFFFQIITKV